MPRSIAWREIDSIARAQLSLLNQLGDMMRLTPDDRRRALNLNDREWHDWTDFLTRQSALPSRPTLPDMLQRVAHVAFNLCLVAEIGTGIHVRG